MANVIEITDFTAPELDVYARLSEGQLLTGGAGEGKVHCRKSKGY